LKRIGILLSWTIGLIVLLCYLGGALLIHDDQYASSAVLWPDDFNETVDISLPGIKRQTLSIATADGQDLDAWLFVVPGSTKLTIVNHGNAGNLSTRGLYAELFTKAKTNILLYDYRGYGKSTGAASVHGILDDGLTVYSYARNKLGYPANEIIEFGESIGSAVACHVAAKETCCALMLFAPLDSLTSAGRWKVPILAIYPDFCFAEQLNNVALISKVHAPIFICHGKKDETLRPEGSQNLFNAAHQPKQLVYLPDSSHYELSPADAALFAKSMIDFVTTLQ
jgi:fermentation-respiration switch protein FrsA (DUF1100 family)